MGLIDPRTAAQRVGSGGTLSFKSRDGDGLLSRRTLHVLLLALVPHCDPLKR